MLQILVICNILLFWAVNFKDCSGHWKIHLLSDYIFSGNLLPIAILIICMHQNLETSRQNSWGCPWHAHDQYSISYTLMWSGHYTLLVLLAPLASYTTLKTKNSAASPAMNPFAVANTGKKHNKVKGSCIALKIANQHLVLSTKKYSYRMQKKTGKSMIFV